MLSHVPTWVFILFFVLLYLGIKRCYTRILSLGRLAIIPAVFVVIGLRNTLQLFGLTSSGILAWAVGVAIGVLLGYLLVKNSLIKADKSKRLIQIPGDITMLIMVMLIFFVEFFVHYAVADHWALADQLLFKPLAVMLSGLVAGVSIGKNSGYFLKYRHAESVPLQGNC